ncbi:hypothetical protein CHU92_15350 [Flavobacterium cyanobacteriorum]|uniref:Prenyltransferase n=1 Tax=Flavobacterium cyanobacteriorum TaxID=2022802 RepID=A0A255YRN5_9FLAO|nr:hypothetical protein [Flavobacterium cyanobacteriorum]OYQ31869.1 hypothetical protein CHU92_15350 [Flavobacterium cyanobacteriorum]
MKLLRQAFTIYIYGSVHVAVAVLSLVLMTNHMFGLPFSLPVALFAFCGTLCGYNFTKYESLYRLKKPKSPRIAVIMGLSLAALAVAGVAFFYLAAAAQIIAIVFLGLTLLYTVPFFPEQTNLRNWSGIKIYIVALCWAGVTLLMPLLNAGVEPYPDVYLKFVQRFLLVIILILIFEIIDLDEDDPHLKTLPQVFGVTKTKIFNLALLLIFYILELFKTVTDKKQLVVNVLLVLAVALFTVYAHPKRPKMYTLFWVEAIPMFWLSCLYIADRL